MVLIKGNRKRRIGRKNKFSIAFTPIPKEKNHINFNPQKRKQGTNFIHAILTGAVAVAWKIAISNH